MPDTTSTAPAPAGKRPNFITSIHCMDGRIQEPLVRYLKETYSVQYVDAITEPGPCKIIAEARENNTLDSIHRRVRVSIEKHGSETIVISGHYDCGGNPADRTGQLDQLERCEEVLHETYPEVGIVRVWINDRWEVERV